MRMIDRIALALMMSLGTISGVAAQAPSEHPGQPLGAEDRLGGVPEGESGRSVGNSPGQLNRTEGFGDHTSSGDMRRGEDSGDAH
jgi:hypothetical protein